MDRLDAIMADIRSRATREEATTPQVPQSPPTTTRSAAGAPGFIGRHRKGLILGAIALFILPSLFSAGRQAVSEALAGSRGPQASATPTASPTRSFVTFTESGTVDMFAVPTPLQWKPVVEQLDARRGLLYMRGTFPIGASFDLDTVAATKSPMRKIDRLMLEMLDAKGWHASGFPMRVISVTEQYVTQGERYPRAMLTVVDELGAYDILDEHDRVVRHVPARPRTTWNVELLNSEYSGWVFMSAERVSAPAQR